MMVSGCPGPAGSVLMREQLRQYGIPDKDIKAFQKGKELAVMECATCHRFFLPREYSPEEWVGIIRNQAKRLSLYHRFSRNGSLINFSGPGA